MSASKILSLPENALLIKIDKPYTDGIQCCSGNIKRFLQGLNSSNDFLDFDFLKQAGCSLDEYAVFRCSESLRSYAEQARLYEKSHDGTFTEELSTKPRPLFGTRYIWNGGSALLSGGVTNALPGASYHNWGLAVDIYFRKFGWEAWDKGKTVKVGDTDYTMPQFYRRSGLVDWARYCGLDWGGDWQGFTDTVHFEDSLSKKLPPKTYWLSENCTYQAYEEVQNALGKFDELSEFEKSVESSSGFFQKFLRGQFPLLSSVFGALGFYVLLRFFRIIRK